MKICIMADLHLPYINEAVQYTALDYFCGEAVKKKAELLLCAGDFTADGNMDAARFFVEKTKACGIPFGIIAGNSDLRTTETSREILALQSPIREKGIFMLRDGDRTLCDEDMAALEAAENITAVFMHHPPRCLLSPCRERFEKWRKAHPEAYVFSAHLHKYEIRGRDVSLPAADPDKAIGSSPRITYFDTESGRITFDSFYCPIPKAFFENIGISCFEPLRDIPYAAQHGVKYLELHNLCPGVDREALKNEIGQWKAKGGKGLSVHAPDIRISNGTVADPASWEAFAALVQQTGADRITLHVPKCTVSEYPVYREIILRFVSDMAAKLPENTVIGIENMHMTGTEKPDESRRFGYTPPEVLAFMTDVKNTVRNPVGINLDIGHARNNAPFSQTYTPGAWYAEVGKHAVGCHIHQVTDEDGKFENHRPLTEPYGKLISLASFFSALQAGQIRTVPIILEIRGGRYTESINWLETEKCKTVCDLHSHTNISRCGRDEPDVLIEKAISQGIDILGICDHSYGVGSEKKEYFALQTALVEKYAGRIRILRGIEIPTVSARYDIDDPAEIDRFDYSLIEHIDLEDSVAKDDLWGFLNQFHTRRGIAHTDLFGYCRARGINPREFFARLKAEDIFWEMNVSFDSTHGYREHGYVAEFFASKEQQQIVLESGAALSVGFDSHIAADYAGERVADACDFLISRGFRLAFVNE